MPFHVHFTYVKKSNNLFQAYYITSFPNPHPHGHELQNIIMIYKINNDELLKTIWLKKKEKKMQ